MVSKPTLLTLGAGASRAYGFPLGPQLKDQIITALGSPESAAIIAEAAGAAPTTVEQFRSELEDSHADSIDTFIESCGEEFDRIGRCVIALELLQLESDDSLFPAEEDWYGALFDAVLRDPTSFRKNFQVITFNFDRSYERRLHRELSKRLAGTPAEGDVYFDDVYYKVTHVHGSLGHLTWQRLYNFGGNMMRDYVPARDTARVAHAAQNVRIYRDRITDGMSSALAWVIGRSERIYFIGFSYHASNLRKLVVPESLAGKDVRGTVLRMGDHAVDQMRALTGGHIQESPSSWGALEVIRECEWFRE